ncbi:acyl-CoA dehydrogenase family protein [Actinomadura fibrosa]|uniref:Acyl-CoA dehydrogenase family protein n=1 Tax=Actinomadura fibrosa TaxID=111802 RepID=A0ABW2XX59_9ACTN|nr:acyl-CoA dehydrogenase family protein [Actinomadura fibrosa]
MSAPDRPGGDRPGGADDLRVLRRAVREALHDLSPPDEVRRQMETERGWDPKTWRRLCGELGIAGLAVPEDLGGAGMSYVELGVVFEEAGRVLLCAPLLSTAGLAIPLLLALDDADARREHLPGLCSGARVATVVTAAPDGRPVHDNATVDAVADGPGFALRGSAGFVVDGADADLLLVPARTADGTAVFAVEAGAPGLGVTRLVTLDPTRKQAALRFDGVPARRLGEPGPDAARALAHALDVGRALLAAEQAGGASWCLDAAVAHAKSRVQFGRPIGSFQAVKQKAAEMLVRVESARSAAMAATQAAAEAASSLAAGSGVVGGRSAGELRDLPGLAVTAAIAKAYCSEAYAFVAAENIQLHGGLGFTWEHDAHLYYKRAWTGGEMLGRPDEHIEGLARHLEGA